MKHISDASQAKLPPEGVNKWEVLRELGVARNSVGITDRALAVLQALLTFHPETILGGNSDELIVFPSNAAICERLNGMPCSTMRRHLSALVRAGLLVRRDSPNGKRFMRRYGEDAQAFGFDLTPLVARFSEFCAAAEKVRAEDEAYRRLRQQVSLMRRDLAGLADYGLEYGAEPEFWQEIASRAAQSARLLRRKLSSDDLADLELDLLSLLDLARDHLDGKTQIMSINDAHFEHHYQNSNPDSHDLEPCFEKAEAESFEPGSGTDGSGGDGDEIQTERNLPNIPLTLVLAVCEEFRQYLPDKVRHWHEFVHMAERLRPMMGISPSAWRDAVEAMGAEQAAVVVVAMLERMSEIKSPGGYLRHLTGRASRGEFSCGPMVMALLRRQEAAA